LQTQGQDDAIANRARASSVTWSRISTDGFFAVQIGNNRPWHGVVEDAPTHETMTVDRERGSVSVQRHRTESALSRVDPALGHDTPPFSKVL